MLWGWIASLALAQPEPPVDPLIRASELGLGVAASRSVAMDMDGEARTFFDRPVFRVSAALATPDCADLTSEPSPDMVDAAPGAWVRLEYQNIGEVPLFPAMITYQADGRFGFHTPSDLFDRPRLAPDESESECFHLDDDPSDFVIRIVGVTDPLIWKSATSFGEAMSPGDRDRTAALALQNLFETDARQRTMLARLQHASGQPSEADSVLIRPDQASSRDTFRLPPKTGVLVFAETTDDEPLTAALHVEGQPVTMAALSIRPAEVSVLADELVLALAGPEAAARAPVRGDRGLMRYLDGVTVRPPAVATRRAADLLIPEAFRAALADLDGLVILPNRDLGRIPWYALAIDGVPLVATHAVAVAPDLAMAFAQPEPWSGRYQRPLVVGDPRLRSRDYEGWTFPPLPGAKAEARAIAEMVGTEALVGRAATRERVLSRARTADLVYLATHGVADADSPMWESFVALHRGRWTAAAVVSEDLEARLAVLSACQTGLGRDISAGTIGLARSFYQAGVPRIVMSLWSVDDEGTRQLMQAFLQHLDDVPPSEALRRAADELRRDGSPASVWASFALMGTIR